MRGKGRARDDAAADVGRADVFGFELDFAVAEEHPVSRAYAPGQVRPADGDLARVAGTGAVAMRSGASSPEIASQANPPASCPAAMTKTGTNRTSASLPSAKLRHSSNPGGNR